ncbi:CRISPR-associated endonuclease Cas1 [Maricaulis sp.]|uniref:CRISPR-associated endonuclease Cas1 n=1 Tax=Maricaulis sp. TaxID=1486257 RepID=UPI003A90814C
MHQSLVREVETPGNDDHYEWAERCRYWLAEYQASIPKRKRRERQAHPLILTGNGMSMRVNRGALVIRDGLTHYPQDVDEHRLFPGGLENPPRIVLVDGSGEISLDAIDWLAEQDISLIRLRWDGRVVSVVGQSGYSADPDKVAWQIATRRGDAARVAFGIPLIRKKLEGTLSNLAAFFPTSAAKDRAVRTAETVLAELELAPVATVDALLGLEGKAANAYFAAWSTIPIRWKSLEKLPVPEDWLTYKSRSALRAKRVPTNRRATHPVNAMLNYVYGMLEIRTRIRAIADGYDPTRGVVHGEGSSGRDGYVFDLMEAGRSEAERRVLRLLVQQEFSKADFATTTTGTCRVQPHLASLIASPSARRW